jgi:type II secretory pathway pseudopilin PulG
MRLSLSKRFWLRLGRAATLPSNLTRLAGSTLAACCLVVGFSASLATAVEPPGSLAIREIRYEGKLSEDEARFMVDIEAEASGKGESSLNLFEGEVALLPPKLPDPLKVVRDGNRYLLTAAHSGRFKLNVELVAKIQRAEPWNQISFTGPSAAIASVTALAGGAGMEVQLLSGTLLESAQTNGVSRVKGFLGADQTVALRWQGKIAEVARRALITADTAITAQLTPTVIKYVTQIRYDLLQGNAPRLSLALPAAQALTRLAGEQIRDWQLKLEGERQILRVEFIKPVEKTCTLTLYSEQTVETTPATARLDPPQPLEIERESGAFTISAEDTLVEFDSVSGLRQVNATDGALAAYRFHGRPFTLALRLKRIEPVITVADHVTARLEETRLLISHNLALDVEKAGIYSLELLPQPGFVVADARGEGVEDWKFADGKVRVNFCARVLGSRKLDVQLEEAHRAFPSQIAVGPLRVTGATKETAQIGAAPAPGISLKTGELQGLREIPARMLPRRAGGAPVSNPGKDDTSAPPVLLTDELLAYTAEQPDWQLALASERLAARIVVEVFNLVTIGDGLVGGSATIRYGLINQGVQEFKVKLPPRCKNVEFTGANIRRKELAGDVWTIGLQDKVWGGYTLVVTYDHQFNPKGEILPVGGLHAVEVERETGSVAITTAANLKLTEQALSDPLRRVDEADLAAADRALITRSVLLAYQYTGDSYDLSLEVQRHEEEPVLEAVADRTQITSVLTDAGQLLTQASFMVKNNEKQFQRFSLPPGAKLWGCYVNGQSAKPERDDEGVLVPLPRDANRDQAFAVDIVYAETTAAIKSRWSQPLRLVAPRTDVPNTYAEWHLYAPAGIRLSSFGGSMSVAQGTTYEMLDAWKKFLAFYAEVLREAGGAILVIGTLALGVIALVISAVRRGWNGVVTVVVVMGILFVLAGMMLPALSKAKLKAQRISSANNLKQIGLAARQFALDNHDRFPTSFEEMMNELNTDKVTYDPESGQRYVYLGAGHSETALRPDSVLAYSPIFNGACSVLFADGSVQTMSAAQFGQLSQRGLVQLATPQQVVLSQQQAAVAQAQLPAQAPMAGHTPGATTPPRRSIRIELPRTGEPFVFTRALNIERRPLAIQASMMSMHTFQTVQMAWQVAAFLLGLAIWWWQWRRVRRNSFVLTLALALIIVSVCSLLIAWRALHDALIVGFPAVLVALLAYLVWKYWPRQKPDESPPPLVEPMSAIPPVTAAFLMAGFLTLASVAHATDAMLPSEPPPAPVSALAAHYTGTVNDRVALLETSLQLAAAKPDQAVALFGEEVAVQQFTVKSGEAKLVRLGKHTGVRLGKRGSATVQFRLLVKIGGNVTKRHLTFAVPPALSSQVALTLDQPEADVDFPTAISFKRAMDGDKTCVEAVMGSAEKIELLWTPRVKRAAEVAATVFCQNAALVTFGGGVMNVRATLDYQVTQGELRQARVRLPAGQRLLRVEGNGIRTWEIKEEKLGEPASLPAHSDTKPPARMPGLPVHGDSREQVLLVELLKGTSPAWRLIVETEKVLDALPATAVVELPHALEVKRETGLMALRGAEELSLAVQAQAGLQRVDAEEFTRAGGEKAEALVSAFRFLKTDFALSVHAEAVQPQLEAVVRHQVRVGADQVNLLSAIDYTIKRAGVFGLKVALPADYRVENVTGTNLLQWTERLDQGARLLEVALKVRTIGAYNLHVELVKTFTDRDRPQFVTTANARGQSELVVGANVGAAAGGDASRSAASGRPNLLPIVGVHPLNTIKLTGFIAVAADPGVATRTESFDGLTEIPAASLPDHAAFGGASGVLAYKFISPEPRPSPEWELNVAIEVVESWVRAEIVNTLTLTENLVSGRALVRYDIANAPVKELRLKIPASFKNVEISGLNLRRRDQDGEVWRVELQSKARGFYTLTVTWEQPRVSRTNAVELAGVGAEGVERETGLLAVAARPPLHVKELQAQDLAKVDTRDFPDWAGRPDDATVLAYRYVRPGYRLALNAQRLIEVGTLRALADSARLTTVVADDGQMMTELSLALRNNGEQFLEVELPPGATVWSAFVAGQPVRPGKRETKLLLPLEKSGADDAPVTVELTYVGTNFFPRVRGQMGFTSPKLNVPLKNARWELFLPPDYDYGDFAGSMAREVAAKPSLLSFSLSEYLAMEKSSKASSQAEMRKDVTAAQSNLSAGNVRDAFANYKRAKQNRYAGKGEADEVEKLEAKLRNVQAGNLIQAQQEFSFNNDAAPSGQRQLSISGGPNAIQYDSAAAEAQWTKLAQAQEISAARVQPLHVNLPLRGLRYAFTQVLQTEENKPMTVQLSAANTKTGNWLRRAGMGAAGFVALWGLVAVVSARKQS